MKLENQVCTIIQGKRLKELGVNARSYFSWFGDENKHNLTDNKEGVTLNAWLYVASTEPINNQQVELRENTEQVTPLAPAFSVAELGVILPEDAGILKENGLFVMHISGQMCVHFEDLKLEPMHSEAEARAAILLFLLENNLTTPEEVNQRLNNA